MINKKVMAVAVASALAAPVAAFAQTSNVQIYGVFDMSVEQLNFKSSTAIATNKNAADAVGAQNHNDIYSQSSRIGFKGTEDLGNGLKAWFQSENGNNVDGRQSVNTGSWAGRNSALGLEGGFGNVFMGIWDTPYKAALVSTMSPYGNGYLGHNGMLLGGGADSTGTVPNLGTDCVGVVSSGNISNATTVCNQLEGNSTSFHRRMSNVIQYWSPTIAGFQGKVAYVGSGNAVDSTTSAATASRTNRPGLWSMSLGYAAGPLALGLAHERHRGFRATGSAAAQSASATITNSNDATDTGTLLTGSYDFGVVKAQLNYERLKYASTDPSLYNTGANPSPILGDNGFTRNAWFLGLSAPIGNGKVLGGYSKTNGNQSCGSLGRSSAGVNVVAGTAGASVATDVGSYFCGSDTGATAWTLGYEYSLSKRTGVYVTYMNVDNKAQANFLPVVGKNVTNGGTVGATGQDLTAFNLGMKHSF